MRKPDTYEIVYGTSAPLDFALRDDGAAFDASGITVALQIERKDGASIATPPTVAWLNQSGSTVRVSGLENLAGGTYLVRYKLTDGNGKIDYVPNDKQTDIWSVVTP